MFKKKYLINSTSFNFNKIKKKDLLLKIILATALSLFLELSIIRIQSSYLHFFSFLKNISLISCFLGLGIGYALRNKSLISLNWVFPLIVIQILTLYFFSQTPISTVLINPIAEQFTMGIDSKKPFTHYNNLFFHIVYFHI